MNVVVHDHPRRLARGIRALRTLRGHRYGIFVHAMARPGEYVLVRYAVRGPVVYHERLITVVSGNRGWFAQQTPYGDHYMELCDVADNPDFVDVRFSRHRGEVPPGVAAGSVYHRVAVLTAAQRKRLFEAGEALVDEYDAAHPPPAAPGPRLVR